VAFGVTYPWEEEAKKYIARGCSMIELGHDLSCLRTLWKNMSTGIRKTL
jgi:hypothetical protein